MIENLASAFREAVAMGGFPLLVFASVLAGLVRGFTGFGKAMVFIPFAGAVLPPVWAVTTVLVFDLIGPLPNVPRALRDGAPMDVLRLAGGAILGLPIGLFLLFRIEPDVFRWMVSIVALSLLGLLVAGWRYRGEIGKRMLAVIGALSGTLGGAIGVPGPPVIMLYMSSRQPVASIRGNILVYLVFFDLLALLVMSMSGRLDLRPMLIGLLLVVPFMTANIVGAALFRPEKERIYRVFSYLLIAASAIMNMPVFR